VIKQTVELKLGPNVRRPRWFVYASLKTTTAINRKMAAALAGLIAASYRSDFHRNDESTLSSFL
jgi:hypothetical protein